MLRVRLSPAQVAALECRGLEDPHDDGEVLLALAWRRGGRTSLAFEPGERDALFVALCDASNAEDGHAEEKGCPYARRAGASLGAVASRVLRS